MIGAGRDRAGEEREGPLRAPASVDEGVLPHALTFFLSAAQRKSVLDRLRREDRDRARALLRALRIETD